MFLKNLDKKKLLYLVPVLAVIGVFILIIFLAMPDQKTIINRKINSIVHYNKAKDLYKKGDYEIAINELLEAAKFNDNDPKINLELGRNYFKLGKTNQAQGLLEKSIGFNNKNKEAALLLTQIYNEKAAYKKTINLLKARKISDSKLFYNLALAYYGIQDLSNSEKNIIEAIKLAPDSANNYNLLGIIYLKQNKLKDAEIQFQTSLHFDEKFNEARYNLAKAYFLDKKFDLALNELKRKLVFERNSEFDWYLIGKIYIEKNDYQNAIKNFLEIFKSDRTETSRIVLEGLVYDLKLVIPKYNEPRTYHVLASAYIGLNQTNKAIKTYESAIKNGISEALIYNNLAALYLKENKIKKAIDNYNRALDLNPYEGVYYYGLGNSYKAARKYSEAIKSYKRAFDVNSDLNIARIALGDLYKEKKDFKNARIYYQKALNVNSKEPYAYLGLAEISLQEGKQEQARDYYNMFASLIPESKLKKLKGL